MALPTPVALVSALARHRKPAWNPGVRVVLHLGKVRDVQVGVTCS